MPTSVVNASWTRTVADDADVGCGTGGAAGPDRAAERDPFEHLVCGERECGADEERAATEHRGRDHARSPEVHQGRGGAAHDEVHERLGPHGGRAAEQSTGDERGPEAVFVVEEAEEPDHAPEHQGEAERVLPEVEGVDRDRAQQPHDPERAPPGAAAEAAGQRPRGERAEDRPEHRQQEHGPVATQLEQRVRGVEHRQRGDVDPLAVDLERVEDRVEVTLRVGRRGPVPDLGHERHRCGPSRGAWRACRRCRSRAFRADRSGRGCTWRRSRAARGTATSGRCNQASRHAKAARSIRGEDRTRPGWSTAVAATAVPVIRRDGRGSA